MNVVGEKDQSEEDNILEEASHLTDAEWASGYFNRVCAVTAVSTGTGTGTEKRTKVRGAKKPKASVAVLYAAVLCCLFGQSEAIQPKGPLICGSQPQDSPQWWRLPELPECKARPHKDALAVPVTAKIYQHNTVEWKTDAYQCKKYRQLASTQVSWTSDVKTANYSVEVQSVSVGECRLMVSGKQCGAGKLLGGPEVAMTQNTLDIEYNWCCTYYHFHVDQCSVIKASVYKQHGKDEFESTAGDVSHCDYSSRTCMLSDQSMLIWEDSKEEHCEYLAQERDFSGDLMEEHFVTTERDIALTFTEHGLNTARTCEGGVASMSDQGLMVEFGQVVAENPKRENRTPVVTVLSNATQPFNDILSWTETSIQALQWSTRENERRIFWESYEFACRNTRATLEWLRLWTPRHPDLAVRHMLQTANVRAVASADWVAIYPCTVVENYTLVGAEPNCTDFVQVDVPWLGGVRRMYMDPITSILQSVSPIVGCSSRRQMIISFEEESFMFDQQTGRRTEMPEGRTLSFGEFMTEVVPVELPTEIFGRVHLLDWHLFANHHSLNAILGTLSRQAEVLRAMGVNPVEGQDVRVSARESTENLFQAGVFSFLFGNHVGSPFDIWMLVCLILYTLEKLVWVFRKTIGRTAVMERGMDRLRTRWDQYRGNNAGVVAVVTEDAESAELEPLTSTGTQVSMTQDVGCQCDSDWIAEGACALPPYTSVYPTLGATAPTQATEREPTKECPYYIRPGPVGPQ